MKQIDKRYVFSWNNVETNDLYELFVIASDDSNYSGTDVVMPSFAITSISVEWERENLPVGLSSAIKLNVEFDLNSLGSNGQDFLDLITNPFETYTYTNGTYSITHSFDVGNIFLLRITNPDTDQITLVFNQKVGLEGLYEDEKLTIECYSVARIAAENCFLEWFKIIYSVYDDTVFKQRQSAWDVFYEHLGIKYLWFTDSLSPSYYFWFMPLKRFYDDIQTVINGLTLKITRGLYSDAYTDGDHYFNVNHYSSNYVLANTQNTLLSYSDLYILAFITNSGTISGSATMYKSFLDELDNYKTAWDYFKVLFKQTLQRARCERRSLAIQGLLDGTAYNIDNEIINKAKLEKYSNVIVRAESSLVEFYEDDVKNLSVIKPSSGNENAETFPIIINNIPPDHPKQMFRFSANGQQARSRADFTISRPNEFRSYFNPIMNNLYYYEEANAIDYVFIRVNSLFDIDFSSTRNSSEIYDLEISYAYDPSALIPRNQQTFTTYNRIIPYLAATLFGQNLQSKLSVKIRNNYDNFEALFINDSPFEYNLSELAPVNFPNLFDNISNKFYITYIKCELMGGSREHNYIEIEGLNNQWEIA